MKEVLFVALAVLWLGSLVALGIAAMEWCEGGQIRRGAMAACVWVALFSVPVGLVFAADGSDSRGRCLRGHQEYQSRHRWPMLVGKMIMPGGTYTSKVWVCEQWSEER